ncbi:transposable element Tcb1 transposase [Trichonephila clavipes]|nr:transposable element Tcb1 transposase [Trichonephila clavipes]
MRICHRWMQEETAHRRGRSHPPRCTTARDDRRIVRMAVMDHVAASRTIAQQIQPITDHSVSSRTIQRRLQQSGISARRPLHRLPSTENHRRLRRQLCNEWWTTTEWNDIVFTDESRFCLQHHDGWIRVWKHRGERLLNCCIMHRHTGSALGIMIWGDIGFYCHSLVRIADTLNSQRYMSEVLEPVVHPNIQRLPSAIF